MKYEHNQIVTRDGEIEIGKNYAYFEEFPHAIACVEVLEDNSNEEFIKFKLKVVKSLNPAMQEEHVFNCSAKRGFYSYDGMWQMKNFNIANIMSAMSPARLVESTGLPKEPMPMEHVKAVCKIGEKGCCRFLILGSGGFECANFDDNSLKARINERADSGKMNAIGKNCEGYGKEK